MKLIDLLNKINNGEEMPDKIKYDDTIFSFNKRQKEYEHQKGNGYYETLLYRVMSTHFIDVLLRAEVEVIEESKEIEEFKTEYTMRQMDMQFQNKINELVRVVNKINKEREEK